MSDVASALDPARYFEAYPSLKYAFAVGVVLITLRLMFNADKARRSMPAAEDETQLSRIERKINRLTWDMGELRRDVDHLIDIVRPGSVARRRPPALDPPPEAG